MIYENYKWAEQQESETFLDILQYSSTAPQTTSSKMIIELNRHLSKHDIGFIPGLFVFILAIGVPNKLVTECIFLFWNGNNLTHQWLPNLQTNKNVTVSCYTDRKLKSIDISSSYFGF